MTTVQVADTVRYSCKKSAKDYDIDVSSFTPEVLESIFTVGMARILGDTHANAKTPAEADAAVLKKLDAWKRGEVRAARGESSADPVAREAMRIAVGQVQRSDKFKAWLVTNKLVATKGDGLAKLNELAKARALSPEVIAQATATIEMDVDLDI